MAYKDKEKEQRNKKEYYQKNKEKILKKARLYNKGWYQSNKKKVQLVHRNYYRQNKNKILQYHKEWYENNKDKILQLTKKYYRQNKNKVQQRHREYNQKNQEKLLQYKGRWQKYRRETNPKYRLDENMGSAVWACLKNKKSGQGWESLVGYALKDLIKHLERQFDDRINWDNYGNYWAVDHIKPKSLFVYNSPDDLEFKQCWNLKNLQPLEKIENIKKRNRYTEN